ncbi:MAG: PHP domain-containing protein, partial [Chloroflexi bacterium]|nr:PHP domain-containing protein [Chloroflexota bacterium]
MKKIDLHIHTVCTPSDIPFVFSLPKLIEYVRRANLDGIAVTNHNCFDARQFKEITAQLDIPVFPGIELVVDGGHLLLLSDVDDLADFDARCRGFGEDAVGVDALRSAFGDLSRYLIIPHYEKKPAVSATVLSQLGALVSAGEVASPKKFRYCINDPERLVPVYFSDIRIQEGLATFPTRQTYISAGDVSLSTIKFCLRDKDKVFLSERDGHRTFDALDNGMKLSTGLNVILGERSTGKTYTLDRLSRDYENVKYIKQFSLLELDEESEVKRFNALLSQKQSLFTQDYLREFKEAVDGMVDVDTAANERKVERYLSSLLTSAKEVERADAFSKAQLFGEVDFSIAPSDALKSLISAVESLIENTEYRSVIQKHVPIDALRSLIVELMSKWAEECELNLKKR